MKGEANCLIATLFSSPAKDSQSSFLCALEAQRLNKENRNLQKDLSVWGSINQMFKSFECCFENHNPNLQPSSESTEDDTKSNVVSWWREQSRGVRGMAGIAFWNLCRWFGILEVVNSNPHPTPPSALSQLSAGRVDQESSLCPGDDSTSAGEAAYGISSALWLWWSVKAARATGWGWKKKKGTQLMHLTLSYIHPCVPSRTVPWHRVVAALKGNHKTSPCPFSYMKSHYQGSPAWNLVAKEVAREPSDLTTSMPLHARTHTC